MVRKKLENEFSWSFSRHNIFEECPKKYWYTYYGSWEGWLSYNKFGANQKSSPLAGYLYAMKQMQSIPMYVGTVVHGVIENVLKNYQRTKQWPHLDDLLKVGYNKFEEGINDAIQCRWRESPKKYANFLEIYYSDRGDDIEKLKTEGLRKVGECIKNWYNSSVRVKYLSSEQTSFIGIENLDSFNVDDIYKVWVVMDLATTWQRGNKETYILFDWKSGKESDKTIDQLYTYALFANKVWGVPYENIIISPFYLANDKYIKIGSNQDEELSINKIEETEDFIRNSCRIMVCKLENQDIAANRAHPLDFEYTTKSYACKNCSYRQLCESVDYLPCDEDQLSESSLIKSKIIN